jgi:GNAT superfamily N-acetyltransferase
VSGPPSEIADTADPAGSATVRPAVPADAPALAAVHIAAWRAAYRGLVPDEVLDGFSVEQRTARWERQLAEFAAPDASGRAWVVELGGDLVGFASTGPLRDDPSDLATHGGEVYAIYLAPELIGRGLGRTLFRRAVDDLVERGFEPILVWVFEANERGRRFYEAAGFAPDGARQPVVFGAVEVPEIRYGRAAADRPDR